MKRTVKEVAESVGAELVGAGDVELKGVASLRSASSGDLVFIEDEKHLSTALTSAASAIIAGRFAVSGTKPFLICDQPRLAFARAAQFLHANKRGSGTIHATAVVHDSAKLANDVTVEEYAVVRERAVIGDQSRVGAGAIIAEGVVVGSFCEIYPNVTIYPGCRLRDRVIVHAGTILGSDGFGYVRDRSSGKYQKFPQIGRLEIEDDVEIGANCTVDRGALDVTRIGRGTKVDNLVHIGHNAIIGENVVIAAQTGVSGSAIIENDVVIGGQVGIADHVRIQEGTILGAQSGIPSKKVIRGKGVVFWGTPARPIRDYLKELAVLARLAKKS